MDFGPAAAGMDEAEILAMFREYSRTLSTIANRGDAEKRQTLASIARNAVEYSQTAELKNVARTSYADLTAKDGNPDLDAIRLALLRELDTYPGVGPNPEGGRRRRRRRARRTRRGRVMRTRLTRRR
jgi:hypothetical protein